MSRAVSRLSFVSVFVSLQAAEQDIIECISDSVATIAPLLSDSKANSSCGGGVLPRAVADVQLQMARLHEIHAAVSNGYTGLHRHALSLSACLVQSQQQSNQRAVNLFWNRELRSSLSRGLTNWLAMVYDGRRFLVFCAARGGCLRS